MCVPLLTTAVTSVDVWCRYAELLWNAVLTFAPALLSVLFLATPIFATRQLTTMGVLLMVGLAIYSILFAINSSIHSYLVVK